MALGAMLGHLCGSPGSLLAYIFPSSVYRNLYFISFAIPDFLYA
ncbi:hypothetical protein CAMRE0001_1410 [Campylobacter rectus RM3267]|uniref:Uncharacterized protein n=1 Tax=Campylobacter rectus RM3267 TaxID=553218 RepID=B9D091_CAMRE|nr:hypothetical protein CAMRE0001_1410 [Campylobacter rectus RM3267]